MASLQLSHNPRPRHIALAHFALRQLCAQDVAFVFSVLASPQRDSFIQDLIQQVEASVPQDDTKFTLSDFKIEPSRIAEKPLILIKMPKVSAYKEAIYIAVVGLFDMDKAQSVANANTSNTFGYYTLSAISDELGSKYHLIRWFEKQWELVAELESLCSLDELSLLLEQHFEQPPEKVESRESRE